MLYISCYRKMKLIYAKNIKVYIYIEQIKLLNKQINK